MTPATPPDSTRRVRLAGLTAGLLDAPTAVEVSDVTLDSRAAGPGALFLACRGHGRHGAEFAGEALARGARAVLYEPSPGARELVAAGVTRSGGADEVFVAAVPELSRRAGIIADRFFGRPSHA